VRSNVSTTHYGLDATNTTANGAYLIQLSVTQGTVLKQSSETLPANEVKSITLSSGNFTLVNPQPVLPKADSAVIIEVTDKIIHQNAGKP
jgi:hypothetical protein